MHFIATRNGKHDVVIAIFTCSDTDAIKTQVQFLRQLKKAIKQWTEHSETGQVHSANGFFNFGDLAINSEDPSLLNILALNDIFDFKAQLVSSAETNFDFDTELLG